MAELQQQVQDAARNNAVLSKAMNNLLAAAVEVDTTAEDAAEETANLIGTGPGHQSSERKPGGRRAESY